VDGIFVLDPFKRPPYSFKEAYHALCGLDTKRGNLDFFDDSGSESTVVSNGSAKRSKRSRIPPIRISTPLQGVSARHARTPPTSPAFPPKTRLPPKSSVTSSEDEQLALKEYFPGNNGIHLAPNTPTTLEHRLRLFERVLAKKRSGQSIGGVRPGNPLEVTTMPAAEFLDDNEFEICCGLRVSPAQYFQSRKMLLDNYWRRGWYNKSAAQKMLRIDVNKTAKLWEFLVQKGWMPTDPRGSALPPPHDL
jgi:SWIRM domain-containing protein